MQTTVLWTNLSNDNNYFQHDIEYHQNALTDEASRYIHDKILTDGINSQFTDGINTHFTDGINTVFTDGINTFFTDGINTFFTDGINTWFTDGINTLKHALL